MKPQINLLLASIRQWMIKLHNQFSERSFHQITLLRIGIYSVLLIQLGMLFPLLLEKSGSKASGAPLFFSAFELGIDIKIVVVIYALALIYGLIRPSLFSRAAVYYLSASTHYQLASIADGGDALMDIMCLLLVLMDERPRSWLANAIGNAALMAARYQVILVYAMAGLGKLHSEPWLSGQALYYVLTIPELSTPFFIKNAEEYWWITVVATYFTLLYQLSFPIGILHSRVRPLLLAIGTLIHLNIAFVQGLTTFGIVMSVSYFVFYGEKRAAYLCALPGKAYRWLRELLLQRFKKFGRIKMPLLSGLFSNDMGDVGINSVVHKFSTDLKIHGGLTSIAASAALSLIVAFHCTAITLLIMPKNPLTRYYDRSVAVYALPHFPQVWLLFGPQFKGYSKKVFARCAEDERTKGGSWFSVSDKFLEAHWENRFSSGGYRLRAIQSATMDLHNKFVAERRQEGCDEDESDCFTRVQKRITGTPEYQQVASLVAPFCRLLHPDANGNAIAEFKLAWIRAPALLGDTTQRKRALEIESYPIFRLGNFGISSNP